MARSQQPVIKRGGRGGERKTERLPPIYVTPSFEKQVLESLGDRDFAEFGREAIEFYITHQGQAAGAAERSVELELSPEQLEKLSALSESFGIKVVAHFIEHLAKRALSVEPRELHSFFYGDFFRSAEAAERAERERLEGARLGGTQSEAADAMPGRKKNGHAA